MRIRINRKVLESWAMTHDTMQRTLGWQFLWKYRSLNTDLRDCLEYGNMNHLDLYFIIYKIIDIISDHDYSEFAQLLFDFQYQNGSRYVNEFEESELRRQIQMRSGRRALQSYLFSVCGNERIHKFAIVLAEHVGFYKDYGVVRNEF